VHIFKVVTQIAHPSVCRFVVAAPFAPTHSRHPCACPHHHTGRCRRNQGQPALNNTRKEMHALTDLIDCPPEVEEPSM
jgi:hypothetical protein